MEIPILRSLRKIPGGLMVIPLLLGAFMNSFFPDALEIGGFTTALLKSGTNAFVALFFVCSGAQIRLREAATPVVKISRSPKYRALSKRKFRRRR